MSDRQKMRELLDRSSLGGPAADAIAAYADPDQVQRVVTAVAQMIDCDLPVKPIGFAQARRLLDVHEGHNCRRLHGAIAYAAAVM